jgi:predicted nucleotide-binding protein
VYGHDLAARNGLELLLRRMGLKPIVLADLPAAGDTIIEMLEKYLRDARNVGYACVLLTPDDQGHRVGAPEETKHRARQNVILELGMVLSRLGRERVAILYKHSVEEAERHRWSYLPRLRRAGGRSQGETVPRAAGGGQ